MHQVNKKRQGYPIFIPERQREFIDVETLHATSLRCKHPQISEIFSTQNPITQRNTDHPYGGCLPDARLPRAGFTSLWLAGGPLAYLLS